MRFNQIRLLFIFCLLTATFFCLVSSASATESSSHSAWLSVTTNTGNISLSDLQTQQTVLGYDLTTQKYFWNTVNDIEKETQTGTFYLINDNTLLFGNQSIVANGNVTHVKLLELGDELYNQYGEAITIISLIPIEGTYDFYKLSINNNHTYFLDGILVHNASRYWVGGTGSWNGTDTTYWSESTGGISGASVPTSADDVFFDANSGAGTTTIATVTATCDDLIFTGFTGTFANSSQELHIYGSFTGAATMTYSFGNRIYFKATTTGKTITSAGTAPTTFTADFIGVGGGWTLQDNWVAGAGTFRHTSGSLDTNGKSITTSGFYSTSSYVRSLTLGNSTINTGIFSFSGATNLTFDAGISSIINVYQFTGGSQTFNTVQMAGSSGETYINDGNNVFANLTKTGSAFLYISGDQTITDTLTITGTSATSRLLVRNTATTTTYSTTPVTLTAANVSITNTDFLYITGAGAANWDISAGSTGDCGNNTGMTLTTPDDLYWVDVDGGSWNTTASWSISSGGASGARVPLCQDDVYIDANSITSGSRTITANMTRLGKNIDFSAVANTPTINLSGHIFGSLTFGNDVTLSGNTALYFDNYENTSITSSGETFSQPIYIFTKPGVTLSLIDELLMSNQIYHYYGTFDANNQNITTTIFGEYLSGTRVLNMGSGTWTLSGTGTVWNMSGTTNLTLNTNISTIKLTNNSVTDKTFAGGTKTYYNFWNATGSTGIVTVSGTNVFNDFKIDAGREVNFTASTNQTVTTFTATGTAESGIILHSTSSTTKATLTKSGAGVISSDYLTINDLTGSPASRWYAGANSTDGLDNSGWVFTVVPQPTVTIAVNNASISETGGTSTVTATLGSYYTSDVTINLAYTGTATLTDDYTRTGTSIVISPNSLTGTVTIGTVGDVLDEDNETVIVDIDSVTNGTESGTQQQTVTITDDDESPTVSIAVDTATIAEAAAVSTITATLSTISGRSVTVNLGYTGTATGTGTDYTASSASIVITAGNLTNTATITAVQDTLDEVDETVIVDVSSVTNGTESGTQQQTVTITDDDTPPTIQFTSTTGSGSEGTTPANLELSLSTASSKEITVDYAVTGGTATGLGVDYTLASGTATVTAGATTTNIAVTVVNDIMDEDSETIIVTISNPTNSSLTANTAETYTITDNDAPPTIQFTSTTGSGSEGTTPANLELSLSTASSKEITVDYAVTGGIATGSGTDYTLVSGTATITAGSTTTNIAVTVVNDTMDEANETIVVTISNPTNSALGANTAETYTITDNDAAPNVTLSTSGSTVAENGDNLTITATLAAISALDATINLSFSGTATADTDYVVSAASISITAGNTTGTITINPSTDTGDEATETILVDISSVTNATEATAQQVSINLTNQDVNAPVVSLTALAPDPHGDTSPTITGTVTDGIGLISAVQYQMDSTAGSWLACTADDGTMDEISEAFSCNSPVITGNASHTVYVRATDDSSNTSGNSSDTFYITFSSPTTTAASSSPPAAPAGGFTATVTNTTTSTSSGSTSSSTTTVPVVTSSSLSLNITAGADTKYVAIATSNNFATANLMPYTPGVQNYQLTTAGPQDLYIKFYNQYGNSTEPLKISVNYQGPTVPTTTTPTTGYLSLWQSVWNKYNAPTVTTNTTTPTIGSTAPTTNTGSTSTNSYLSSWQSVWSKYSAPAVMGQKIVSKPVPSINPPTSGPEPTVVPQNINPSSYVFTYNLELGMVDTAVREMQTILARYPDIYHEATVSGYFGRQTLSAVQRFQERYGLAKLGGAGYGYVGPKTRELLNEL